MRADEIFRDVEDHAHTAGAGSQQAEGARWPVTDPVCEVAQTRRRHSDGRAEAPAEAGERVEPDCGRDIDDRFRLCEQQVLGALDPQRREVLAGTDPHMAREESGEVERAVSGVIREVGRTQLRGPLTCERDR